MAHVGEGLPVRNYDESPALKRCDLVQKLVRAYHGECESAVHP